MNSHASEPDSNRPATTDELLSHADWVRRLSRALLSDANEAEDVAQDAWVAALKRPPTAGDGLRGWWARVVRSTASNHRRSESRRTEREQRIASERAEATDPQIDMTLEAHRRLAAAIEALDEPLRGVIVAHYFHGASSREIAEREGVADSTIRTRLQKALEKLRRELDLRAGGDRGAWAALLAPLAKLERAVVPAVLVAGWIKLAAGLALVGVAGLLAHQALGTRTVPAGPAVASPEAARDPEPPLSADSTDSQRKADVPATVQASTASAAPAEEPVARVEARVFDAHGLPIRGARLQFLDRIQLQECAEDEAPHGLTDGTGLAAISVRLTDRSPRRASVAGLPPRTWYGPFELSAQGHATRSVTAKLALGESTSLGDIVLEVGGDLSGRCLASDGRALPGTSVTLLSPDLTLEERLQAQRGQFRRAERLRSATCGKDGSFSMRGAPAGRFRICASSEDLATAISEPFLLAAGEELRVPDLLLAECAGTIRGIVLNPDGGPCAKAEVGFQQNAAGTWSATHCAEDGTFVLSGISAAEVDICAHLTPGNVGERLLRGVRAGETGLVLQLPEPRRFEVHVEDPSGAPVSKFSLDLKHSDTPGRDTYIGYRDSTASTLPLVASARPFIARVEVDGYAALEQGPFTQLDVPETLTFRLQPSACVRGRVVLDGKPTRSLRVRLAPLRDEPRVRADGMPSRAIEGAQGYPDADGRFAIGVGRGGTYVLSVQARSGVLAFTRTLELAVGQPVEEIVADLASTGSIAGRVTTTYDTRSRAAQVMYSCGLGETRSEQIAADGSYRLDGLAPGTWWVRITPDVRPSSALLPAGTQVEDPLLRRIEVAANSVATCDFDLGSVPARRIDGHLLLGGQAPATWTASITAQNASGDAQRFSAPIRADGNFELQVSDFGSLPLMLRSPGRIDRDDFIEIGLAVPAEGQRWSFACDVGTLDVEGKPAAQIQILADLANGATWTTHAILDANGHAALDSLPAAKARVSLAGSKDSPVEVEIPAHGRAQARLP